jgi:hypothetical protein
MIPAIFILIGVLGIWIGFTARGNDMWKAITSMEFKPLGT